MTPVIAENERELVHQLLEDVRTIMTVPNFPTPSPAHTRSVLVPILRRWIVEGGLFRAQCLIAPREIKFEVSINKNAERLCEAGYNEYWMAIVLFGEIGVGVSLAAKDLIGQTRPCPEGEFRQLLHPAKSFFKQKMFYWKGQFYTRHDAIYIHANKLGGVHLDFQRAPNEEHINEIRNYLGFDKEATPLQLIAGDEITLARADSRRRQNIYDAVDLVALDTARIFAHGIQASAHLFEVLLQ